jgi:thioredoxin-related protein
MKQLILVLAASLLTTISFSQDMSKFKIYNPAANAEADILAAVTKAKSEGKHVFIQVGGNWCIWCARFNALTTENKSIDSLIQAGYVVYHLNYSKENTNEKLLAKYGYPQRFGFPVFLVLDAEGKLLHTQNSSYLEQDKGYNINTVKGFFNDWSPAALDPARYKPE